MAEFFKIEELFNAYLKGQCTKEQAQVLLEQFNMAGTEAYFNQLILEEFEKEDAADLKRDHLEQLTNIFEKIRKRIKDSDGANSSSGT